ncbi:MAG: GAF domain-containing protein [Deferrisomatales bacterium]
MPATPKRLFETLCDVTGRLTLELELERLLPEVCRQGAQAVGADGACVRLVDPETATLRLVGAYGLSREYLDKGPVGADRSLRAALDGETVLVEDAWTDSRAEYPEANRREGIRSILAVPLALRGEVIGVLRLYFRQPARPSDEELLFCTVLAEECALAIENARLVQLLREVRDAVVRRSSERLAAMAYYDPPKQCR